MRSTGFCDEHEITPERLPPTTDEEFFRRDAAGTDHEIYRTDDMAADDLTKSDSGAGKPDTGQALAMLSTFASVGTKIFDLSITDLDGCPVRGLQRPDRSLEDLRRRIGRDLQDGARNQHNVIIRPRSQTALLIQLDDFSQAKAAVKFTFNSQCCTGSVSADGRIIRWSNGTSWTKQ